MRLSCRGKRSVHRMRQAGEAPKRYASAMRRRLVTICVCLLLGAVINVAVALALARFGPRPRISFDNLGQEIALCESDIMLWTAFAPPEWKEPPTRGFLHAL